MVPQVLPKVVSSMSLIPVQYSATVVSWHMHCDLHVSAFLSHLQGDTKHDKFLLYLVSP
jgi:hypothetical protein